MPLQRRLAAHHQDPRPREAPDQVYERNQAPEIGRVIGPVETPEAEAFVIALQLATARQVEDSARVAGKKRPDDGAPDPMTLARRHDHDGGELPATVAVCFDLAHAGDGAVLLSHDEVRPVEIHGVQPRVLDQVADSGLILRDCGADLDGHLLQATRPGAK